MMKNSVCEESFYIESEEEEYDENESDFSDEDNNDDENNRPNYSLTSAWPQSYRKSMDLYSNVSSPSLDFLGAPSLSQLGSSFFGSSLIRRNTPEILPSLHKPLIPPAEEEKAVYKHISHDEKPSKDADGLPISRQSSYGQAVVNGMNVLCGVGILSTPYAVKEGGWAGLPILFIFGVLSFYTGMLLRYCLDSQLGIETYPDMVRLLLKHFLFMILIRFRIVVFLWMQIFLYVELYASCVDIIIVEGDNLLAIFPNAHLSLGGFELDARHLFVVLTTLAVLPTVWMHDLSVLSYISVGGVIASVLVVLCLYWAGLVDHVGFESKGTVLNLPTLPVAIGLYGFCFGGHAVFPNIYTSLAYFVMVTLLYGGTAVLGYLMFGDSTESQFTLNLPKGLIASKVAVWTTVVNPFTKYALTLSPVAMSLEELLPPKHAKSHVYPILIRTALTISTSLVGLAVPFFGAVTLSNLHLPISDDSNTTLCLLSENLEGENKPPSGYNMCPYYHNRYCICIDRFVFSSLQYHPEHGLNFEYGTRSCF
ncbi:hypothetical protein H5410_015785 [Solanum commersonii]|uniref:Amino acid transporter transmembrane domain-containing protein n=1 Tax=Solanum commersonii TaxID=4109 RepID=A0A9J5ZUP2_SOLCO|nr:hypothetical protein H5410_015785 [Solanum commersonii]